MAFTNPIWLYAFLGLLIPIAIHLWNKKELKTIQVGSVLWFPKGSSQKSRSLKLKDLLLLLLRLLLLSLLIIILAEPSIRSSDKSTSKSVFIDPDLDFNENSQLNTVIDSLINDGYTSYWFAEGFPSLDDEKPNVELDYWSLIEDVNSLFEGEKLVFMATKANRLRGERPEVSDNLKLITKDEGAEDSEFVLEQIDLKAGFKVIRGNTSNNAIYFDSKTVMNMASNKGILIKDSFSIKLEADQEFKTEEEYLNSAIESIKEYTSWPITLKGKGQPDLTIWLKEGRYEGNSEHLIKYKSILTNNYFEVSNDFDGFYLTKRVRSSDRNLSSLPAELLVIIRGVMGNYSSVIEGNDTRLVDESQIEVNHSIENKASIINQSVNHIIFFFLLMVLLVERLLAARKNL